jgi:methyl-accepting chemotaxis protein
MRKIALMRVNRGEVMRITVSAKILSIGLLLPISFLLLGAILFWQDRQLSHAAAQNAEATNMLTLVAGTRGALLQMRLREQGFVTQPSDESLRGHAAASARLDDVMTKLQQALTTAEEKQLFTELAAKRVEYNRATAVLFDTYRLMGFNQDLGLQGTLRRAVRELEAKIEETKNRDFEADILRLRRDEKDFQLRVQDRYIKSIKDNIALLAAKLNATGLAVLMPLLDTYDRELSAYADARLKVAEQATNVNNVGEAMIPIINKLFDINSAEAATASNEAAAARAGASRLLSILMVVIGLGGFVLAFLIGRSISGPLVNMIGIMDALAKGDFHRDVPVLKRTDEIADMAAALGVFRSNAAERQRMEQQERDRLEQERKQEILQRERDAAVSREIQEFCAGVAAGDLSKRLSAEGKEGVLKQLSEQLNELAVTLDEITSSIASVAGRMAEGDLTNRVSGNYRGVFGELTSGINSMSERLSAFAGQLGSTAEAVRSASSEISAGSQDLAGRTESQAASIEQTSASMQQIVSTVRSNADNAEAANQLAAASRQSADRGGGIVGEAVSAMTQIEESASKISDIVAMIDEIAFQTNLLALNASVEAARAGEAGKGFAVVAQEVRALAQRSANASKEIKGLISASNTQVKVGAGLVKQAGDSLVEIVTAGRKVSEIVAEIAGASREQTIGLEQISTAVNSMDEMTQRNAALVEQTTAAAQALSGQSAELAKMVAFFKIKPALPSREAHQAPAPASAASPQHMQPKRKPAPAAASTGTKGDDWREF